MTSEAPKEIYAWVYDQWKTAWNVDPEESDASASRYTLTAHAQAMVAAERDACAAIAEAEMKRNAAETYSGGTVTIHKANQSAAKCYASGAILETIRARTPDDAQAALDALLKAEREKALREVMQAVDEWYHNIGEGTPAAEIAAMIGMEIKDDDV